MAKNFSLHSEVGRDALISFVSIHHALPRSHRDPALSQSQLNSFFDLSSFRPSETEIVRASDGFEECETDRTSGSEAEA